MKNPHRKGLAGPVFDYLAWSWAVAIALVPFSLGGVIVASLLGASPTLVVAMGAIVPGTAWLTGVVRYPATPIYYAITWIRKAREQTAVEGD